MAEDKKQYVEDFQDILAKNGAYAPKEIGVRIKYLEFQGREVLVCRGHAVNVSGDSLIAIAGEMERLIVGESSPHDSRAMWHNPELRAAYESEFARSREDA